MTKSFGFATLLAVALSLTAISCSGPVFFKNAVAAAPAAASPAPGVTVAANSGGASATGAVSAPSTQPSGLQSSLAFLDKPEWNGATIFGGFALVFVLMIGISGIVLARRS
jgi:hypothetical protein